jgi:hypothetical protein
MLNNCSFQFLAFNNVNMLVNGITPIIFSHNRDLVFAHDNHVPKYASHIHHAYYNTLLNANGDVKIKLRIMMDYVIIYHAYTLFLFYNMFVGTNFYFPTSIEHELRQNEILRASFM